MPHLIKNMAKEVFDYYKDGISEYSPLFYGFHKHNGKLSIDTKRLKKVFEYEGYKIEDYFGVADLLNYPRNTHYFVPKKKKRYDYMVNYLVDTLKILLKDWKEEYLPMISNIKTPNQIEGETIANRIAFTLSSDDYDDIFEFASIKKTLRESKYNELIKSICIQYLQKVSAEFLRIVFFVLAKNGFKNELDLGKFTDVTRYVQKKFFKEYGKNNPIFTLPHYRYFLLSSLLSNFTKHNSLSGYMDLYNNPFERDPEVKKFLKSFVYGDEEHKFTNGDYSLNWVRIDLGTIEQIIDGLIDFSYEFCELVFDESSYDSMWNYDSYLISCINKFIRQVIDCDWGII